MEGKLVYFEETPVPATRSSISKDVFDADFEITEAYGAARKEDQPKTAAVEKIEDTAPKKQQELDRGDFNESDTIFKTGGFEEPSKSYNYEARLSQYESSLLTRFHPPTTGRPSSSGFSNMSLTGVTPRPLFPNNIAPGGQAVKTQFDSTLTGFGCTNEDIARLPRRAYGYKGFKSSRGRNSEMRPRSENNNSMAHNNNDVEATKNLTMSSNSDTLAMRRMMAFGAPLTGRRASAFGEEMRGLLEVPPKKPRRSNTTCSICGKLGHGAEDCYSNAVAPKTEVRCYNCNQYGHYAVRCPISPTIKRPSGMPLHAASRIAAARQNPEARREKEKPQNKLSESEKKGLEVICKLMKDKHLREETAKTTPQLYDEMLSYMIDHVNIGPCKNSSE